MRRRNLLGESGEIFTIEITSESIYPSASTKTYTINLLINGRAPVGKSASDYTIVTKTNFCSGATVSSDGTYMSYTVSGYYNCGSSSTYQEASITINYKGQAQTYNVTMNSDYTTRTSTSTEIAPYRCASGDASISDMVWDGTKVTFNLTWPNQIVKRIYHYTTYYYSGVSSSSKQLDSYVSGYTLSGSYCVTFASLASLPTTKVVNDSSKTYGSPVALKKSGALTWNLLMYAEKEDGEYYFPIYTFESLTDGSHGEASSTRAVARVDSNGNFKIAYWIDY